MSNTLNEDVSGVLEFLSGCRDTFWSSDCEIRESPVGGLGVFAGEDLGKGTTLLKIPKSCLFSASNSTIANLLVDDEIDGVLALNIAFIYETTVFSEKSHWVPYLKSIRVSDGEQTLVLPPSYWSGEIRRSLRGTTLDTLHDGLRSETEVQEGFELAVDLANKWNREFGLAIPRGFFDVQPHDRDDTRCKFHRFVATAYALSSRIFEIDAHHENALVPIADLFNHSTSAPDVRFSSLYEVCQLCGEPGMCKHLVAEAVLEAQENGDKDGILASDGESGEEQDDDTSKEDELVDMTLERDVKRGQEIFNSYGELSNALLLARYGFAVQHNPHDVVHLGREVKRLVRHCGRYAARTSWWRQTGWRAYTGGRADRARQKPWLSEMFIDSHGVPSRALAAFLNLLEMEGAQWLKLRNAPSTRVQELRRMGPIGIRAHLQRLLAYKKMSWHPSQHSIPASAQIILDSERKIVERARALVLQRAAASSLD